MDLNTILDLKPQYLRYGDPTEYSFIKNCIGSIDQWDTIVNSKEGAPIIAKWREELALKLSSEAFSRILEASRGETRDALGANKYIYEALSSQKEDKKVGRPSREAIAKEAHRLVEDDKQREEALQRLQDAVHKTE